MHLIWMLVWNESRYFCWIFGVCSNMRNRPQSCHRQNDDWLAVKFWGSPFSHNLGMLSWTLFVGGIWYIYIYKHWISTNKHGSLIKNEKWIDKHESLMSKHGSSKEWIQWIHFNIATSSVSFHATYHDISKYSKRMWKTRGHRCGPCRIGMEPHGGCGWFHLSFPYRFPIVSLWFPTVPESLCFHLPDSEFWACQICRCDPICLLLKLWVIALELLDCRARVGW